MIHIGIDPGRGGAIAAVTSAGNFVEAVRFKDAVVEGQIAYLIEDFIQTYCDGPFTSVIEKVHSMPQQGVVSTFTFGAAYGEALGAIALLSKVELVTPQRWQKDLGLLTRKPETKAEHKKRIRQSAELRWRSRFSADITDAIYIAEWSRLYGANSLTHKEAGHG